MVTIVRPPMVVKICIHFDVWPRVRRVVKTPDGQATSPESSSLTGIWSAGVKLKLHTKPPNRHSSIPDGTSNFASTALAFWLRPYM